MSPKEIRIWPDSTLTKPSEPITHFDAALRALVRDLIDTMNHEGNAAGLAAPQIGVNKRVFMVDIPPEDNNGNGTNGKQAFINPVFIKKEGKMEWQEACLSVPGEAGYVTRARHVVMRYMDLDGNQQEIDAVDYLAGCLQHETDHLDGKLWVDHQSRLKRELVRKKMLKFKTEHKR